MILEMKNILRLIFGNSRNHIISQVIKLGQSPAGAYQINETTWDDIKDKAGVKDFSPKSQDIFAKYLM